MIGNEDLFSSLDSSVTSQIKLGDDYQKKVLGNGVVYVDVWTTSRRHSIKIIINNIIIIDC